MSEDGDQEALIPVIDCEEAVRDAGELGGVASGPVAAAVERDDVRDQARSLGAAGVLRGRRDGVSLGALSWVGASTFGVLRGVPAGEAEGSDTSALPARLPAGFGVRALDGAASAEKVTSVHRATAAELKRGKERPLWATFIARITGLTQVLNSGERLHACRGICSWML